ncbi:major facilitator superfamily transporter [Colletotrichum tofieldiae]|nr:major facilitator superfamily transporter [Colletotrichum tofieldiae]
MLIARFLVGVGGSVFSSVIGGVIADLWVKDQRNTPMALFSGAVLAGTGAGPLVASVIVKRMGAEDGTMAWKWIFWHQVIIDTVLVIALAVLFEESRGSVILSRKAKALNDWYQAREESGYFGVWPKARRPRTETPTRLQTRAIASHVLVLGRKSHVQFTARVGRVPPGSSPRDCGGW